jgi:uncharacterized membrane protein
MASPLDQPPEAFPKHFLVRIGSAIGGIAFGMTIFEYFFPFLRDHAPSQGIPYGTLAFWGVWILVFALLEHYWVPKPNIPPVSPEIKKQQRLYLAAIVVLAVIDLGISVMIMQKWNSGSEEGILVLMGLWLVIAVISMVVLILFTIFIMDNKEKNRKAKAAAGSIIPQQGPILKEKDP